MRVAGNGQSRIDCRRVDWKRSHQRRHGVQRGQQPALGDGAGEYESPRIFLKCQQCIQQGHERAGWCDLHEGQLARVLVCRKYAANGERRRIRVADGGVVPVRQRPIRELHAGQKCERLAIFGALEWVAGLGKSQHGQAGGVDIGHRRRKGPAPASVWVLLVDQGLAGRGGRRRAGRMQGQHGQIMPIQPGVVVSARFRVVVALNARDQVQSAEVAGVTAGGHGSPGGLGRFGGAIAGPIDVGRRQSLQRVQSALSPCRPGCAIRVLADSGDGYNGIAARACRPEAARAGEGLVAAGVVAALLGVQPRDGALRSQVWMTGRRDMAQQAHDAEECGTDVRQPGLGGWECPRARLQG